MGAPDSGLVRPMVRDMEAEWQVVETVSDRFQAEMVVARLRQAGIPALIQADDGAGWVPAMLHMKGVAVLVPPHHLGAAGSVMRSGEGLEEE